VSDVVIGAEAMGIAGPDDAEDTDRSSYGWRRTWARFRRKPSAMVALGVVVLMLLIGILAPWIAPYDLGETSNQYLAGPSSDHWLGTDTIGNDTLSQVLHGTRTSLFAAGVAVLLALAGGLLVGLTSGYFGGTVDRLLMRFMEAIMIIPDLILAIVILGVLGPSVVNAMIGLAVGSVPGFSRLIRGQVLGTREEQFVEAARVVGAPATRIIRRHIVPNILPFVVVQVCMSMGFMLLAEGGLAFLGLSAQPPDTSLGAILQKGFTNINTTVRLILVPGLVITVLSLSFNLVADGLRDSLARHDASDVGRG